MVRHPIRLSISTAERLDGLSIWDGMSASRPEQPSAPAKLERSTMADRRNTMMEPPVEELLDKVDSKFTLVTLSARRAREINSYFNQLGEGLGALAPPQVTSVSRKPLSIALEEVAASKVVVAPKGAPAGEDDDETAKAEGSSASEAATPAPGTGDEAS